MIRVKSAGERDYTQLFPQCYQVVALASDVLTDASEASTFRRMHTTDVSSTLARLFSELVEGAARDGAFILNSGDAGLLRSLERISEFDASRSLNGGATIAAHAQHLRYGLSLMNRWARDGGNPFADATWDAAWKIGVVNEQEWQEIRDGLRAEAQQWLAALAAPRQASDAELTGMVGSIAHLAYHLGAIRQISKEARGPKEGQFQEPSPR